MIIIWGSWLAFDAGTTLTLSFQSVMALCVTNLCASAGALTWACMAFFETGRWSIDATFMGAIAGLVMINAGSWLHRHADGILLGIFGAILCRQALRIKFTDAARHRRWVDNGDTFATHCVGGIAANDSNWSVRAEGSRCLRGVGDCRWRVLRWEHQAARSPSWSKCWLG